MYHAIVALLMLAAPLASILIEGGLHPGQPWPLLIGKWLVFWAVGVRLFIAGLRQILQPRYTAQTILGLQGDDALLLVRELGFGNVSFGVLGLATLWMPGWLWGAALAGGLFYGLAGINHALQAHRNAKENTAMVSDLYAAVALLGCCGWAFAKAAA